MIAFSNYTTKGNSTALFYNNNADLGGAVACLSYCNVLFKENSSLNFCNNSAKYGGVLFCFEAVVVVEGNTNIVFISNKAKWRGGALNCLNYCNFTLKRLVLFIILEIQLLNLVEQFIL